MQLVEEELFRDLLTTGVMVLVNNLINISYPTTQFFFSLACRINVITDNFHYPQSFEKNKKIFHPEFPLSPQPFLACLIVKEVLTY